MCSRTMPIVCVTGCSWRSGHKGLRDADSILYNVKNTFSMYKNEKKGVAGHRSVAAEDVSTMHKHPDSA